MDTTLSIRVDKKLKQEFLSKTKERWLEWAVLIRYFMEKVSSEPSVIRFDLDERIFDELLKDPSVTSRLEKISSKLDDLWF